jgi:hypothetical protein
LQAINHDFSVSKKLFHSDVKLTECLNIQKLSIFERKVGCIFVVKDALCENLWFAFLLYILKYVLQKLQYFLPGIVP